MAGRFLHHIPADDEGHGGGADALARTVTAIQGAGFTVDKQLWPSAIGSCTGCHGGCHDDPPPPPAR